MKRRITDITSIILNDSSDPIFAFNREGEYLYVNNAFSTPFERTPEEIIGKKIWDIFPGEQGDHRFKAVRQAFETLEMVVLEVKVETEKVRQFYITTVKPIISDDGSCNTVICISKNITDRKIIEEELELSKRDADMKNIELDKLVRELYQKSISDGLTGIFNRRHIIDILYHEIERSKRCNSELVLIMLDVDHFKSVNDKFGHLVGDKVLIKITTAINEVIGEKGFLGRYGGEEFLILIPGQNREISLELAENTRIEIEKKCFEEHSVCATVSLGVAFYKNYTVDEFLIAADEALYKAKANGRNRVEVSS